MEKNKPIKRILLVVGFLLWIVGIRFFFQIIAYSNLGAVWGFIIDFLSLIISFIFLEFIIFKW